MYRREGAKQAQIAGYRLDLSPQRPAGASYGWQIEAQSGSATTTTDYEFLMWEDLVRASMTRSVLTTYLVMLRTIWVYVASGALFGLVRLRPAPIIAALYPVIGLLAQAALAAGAGWLILRALGGMIGTGPALCLALIGATAVLWMFRRRDRRLFVYYLMNDYAYTSWHSGAWDPALQARIDAFAGRIKEVMAQGEVDEVLVVGHSSGAQIAVGVLEQILWDRPGGPNLSFLSLGQVIPMLSFLPEAQELRRALHAVSASDALTWVDVSAPGDGGSFALTDPVKVTGVAPEAARWPLVISAAFSQTMAPDWLKSTRWRFFRRHFQYLCAFDSPDRYDFFAITAGPQTLAARFADRAPSASRIEAPLSAYRDF